VIGRIIKIAALFVAFILVVGISAYLALTLVIKSEDTVVVPKLVGKNVVYVLEFLTDLGLNTKVKGSEYSADVPKNHVIHQEPEPGAEIKKGRDVRMPNLRGLSVQQSRIILEENGLCQGEISTTYSKSIKKDEIIAQVPSSGTLITRGGCVHLLVSMGIRPKGYMMPDLVGISLDDAIPLIERSDLVLENIRSIFYKEKPQHTIVEQDPPAGYRVFEKSAVSLVINRKSGVKSQSYLSGAYGVSLFRYRLNAGFLKRHIRVRLNSYGVSNDIFNDIMRPGEEVWLLVPKNVNATVLLYENDKLIKTEVFDTW